METPLKRLQKLAVMRKERLEKAASMVDKMKLQADAAAKVSQEVKSAKD